MRITTQVRDSVFELLSKAQSAHLMICKLIDHPSEELEEQVNTMLKEIKSLTREI